MKAIEIYKLHWTAVISRFTGSIRECLTFKTTKKLFYTSVELIVTLLILLKCSLENYIQLTNLIRRYT